MAARNLTRAAASLAMTQPAVSNALRRLRDALGDESWWCVRATASRRRREQSLYGLWCEALASLQASVAPAVFDPATSRQNFVLAMADATAAIPGATTGARTLRRPRLA